MELKSSLIMQKTVAYISTAGKVNCRTFEMNFDQPDNTKFFKIKGTIQDAAPRATISFMPSVTAQVLPMP